MRMTYDAEADAVWIELRSGVHGAEGVSVAPSVIASLDADGHIVGLEILDARARLGDAVLAESVPIEQLTPVARANDRRPAPRETEPALPT